VAQVASARDGHREDQCGKHSWFTTQPMPWTRPSAGRRGSMDTRTGPDDGLLAVHGQGHCFTPWKELDVNPNAIVDQVDRRPA